MTPRRIGLASKVSAITLADLTRIAAAINLQISRDFFPIWQVNATVSALPSPDAVPPGVWPIFLVESTGYDTAAGLHLTKANQPYALVQNGPTWSLTASHECLEMLVDPSGNKLQTSSGIDVKGGKVVDLPGVKFDYLVEVADPAEDAENAYLIDDVLVSDFYTPNFFDPVAASGVRYSFTGSLKRPREVLNGGYLSWYDPDDDRMHQLKFWDKPQIVTLPGHPSRSSRRSLRGFVDSQTPPPVRLSAVSLKDAAGGHQKDRMAWIALAAVKNAAAFTAASATKETVADQNPIQPLADIIDKNQETLLPDGATRVYAGWHFEDKWITRERAIVIQAHTPDLERVRAAVPVKFKGYIIDVRRDPRKQKKVDDTTEAMMAMAPGAVREELALPTMPGERSAGPEAAALMAARPPKKPSVDYEAPAGKKYDFREFTEQMTLRLHVSPDRGWPELNDFLTPAEDDMVVGIYQCTAPHIQAALEEGLGTGGRLTMTMDSPPDGKKREQTVQDTDNNLENDLGNRFDFAWALSGLGKMTAKKIFPTAYHIKVAVKDKKKFWLSSGNWNTSNQPAIDPNDTDSLLKASRECDRDWHVICECPKLAEFYEGYLEQDYKTAKKVAKRATTAAATAAAQLQVEEPDDDYAGLMAQNATKFFDTKVISRKVKVFPLLTPDEGGYRKPIIDIINGAEKTIYMQTQYIHTIDEDQDTARPSHMDLIDAIVARYKAGVTVKLITSEYQDTMWVERLQDAGIDAVDVLKIQNRVHNKGMVIDSAVCVVSSQNWSSQGTGENRDAGLIIYDEEAAQYFEEVFLHDWDRAQQRVAR